jgi:hypothetical protein
MTKPMSRRILARALAVLTLGLMVLPLAPVGPASASSEVAVKLSKQTWWWRDQIDREVKVVPPVPGAPTVVTRVKRPAPFPLGRLPIAVSGAQDTKVSAIGFDLLLANIPMGSTISSFKVTLKESDWIADAQAQLAARKGFEPQYNADTATVLACPIGGFWAETDGAEAYTALSETNEVVNQVPAYDCASGVPAERDAAAEGGPTWTFDLTALAQEWSDSPFENNGVMLFPDLAAASSAQWQVALIGNTRDASGVGTILSGKATYTPPEESPTTSPSPSPFDTGGGSGFTPPPSLPPSSPLPSPVSSPTQAPPQAVPVADTSGSAIPGYVWLLVPVGLVALAMVRSVVLEPVGGRRSNGALAAIRSVNAERRGTGASGASLGFVGAAFASLFASIRDDLARIRSKTKRTRP